MEEIINSIINGQRVQAIEQLKDSPYSFEDLIIILEEEDMCNEITKMYNTALNVGYIIEESYP